MSRSLHHIDTQFDGLLLMHAKRCIQLASQCTFPSARMILQLLAADLLLANRKPMGARLTPRASTLSARM